jgi:alcohol dehydrogenase, propanol-preferring
MKAVQLVRWQQEPELREVAVPEPGAIEVLVKVEAAGLCHSDLHVIDWPEGTLAWELPFTLGHETAGTVAAAGESVTAFDEGDAVLVYGPWGCGTCWQCVRGSENLCPNRSSGGCGLGFDGGLADYVLVPSPRLLVPIGDLDPVRAAPLTDAALTSYHAIKPELPRLRPGSSVVVIGVGGLGHVAVQLLHRLSPARIVAVDPREAARALALHAGADVALDADGDVCGHVSIVGLAGGTFPMAFGTLPLEWSAGKPSWGTLPELHEVVALAHAGAIDIEVERLLLEDAVDGYRRLRNGEIVGRAVVVP